MLVNFISFKTDLASLGQGLSKIVPQGCLGLHFLGYLVGVALISPAPDARSRNFRGKNSMFFVHFPSKAIFGLQGPPGPRKAPQMTSPGPQNSCLGSRAGVINLFNFVTKILWGYLQWTNLGLTKLMEVSTFEIDFTKIQILQISSFLRPQKTPKKVQRPQNTFFCPRGPLKGPIGPL